MKLFNYIIEVGFRSRHKWSHFKLHDNRRRLNYQHLIWGKLSILWGQPHLVEIECCEFCLDQVEHMGEDGISVCEGCGIVEGHTKTLTAEEWENAY
jgi:hypothetical protein